ncbi:MAG: type II/IV secretion system protein [Rhodocyclaceae bacterium]|jgi:type IV pilus assembly protein PilB|nr:type II/IV secretion system protein [Rhodocyclaceae bacterium]
MTETTHPLVAAARRRHPEVMLPPGASISPATSEAWAQVAGIFQISTGELAACVAELFGAEPGDLKRFQPAAGSCLPERLCRQMNLVPLWFDETTVCVALADPRLSPDQLSQLGFACGRKLRISVLPPDDIDTCLLRLFAGGQSYAASKLHAIDLLASIDNDANQATVKLALAIFRTAIDRNASDVHIHPFVGGGAIRFRIDGRMRRMATIPMASLEGVSRFLRSNAGLELSTLKAQDGRLRFKYGRREIDVRLSMLPTYDGERIVCRLLDQSRNFSLQQSRFSLSDQQALRRLTAHSAGIVLLTGPTGSGKTSTLYALLAELNSVDVNIMTIEDPVEYVLPGISQVQVNERQGLSFADTLRAILRQDPDIVLVGEIRDEETARIATQAALTGHLVLSTLHTNDALGTIPRLLDLGLEASTLADALIGVVSQRLVRRLCEHCRAPRQAPSLPIEEEFSRITKELPAYRAVGCAECDYSGYRGRLPVIERLENSPVLRQSLLTGGRSLATLKEASLGYRRSMAASAKDWIVSGWTTPGEVQQVLGMKFWNELAEEHGVDLGTLNFDVSGDGRADRRMKLLLVSHDTALGETLAAALPYGVARVADAAGALDYLEQQGNVIALVFDSAASGSDPEAWLTQLRTELASAGLPGLFIVRDQASTLQSLLVQHGAPSLPHAAVATDELPATLTRLLQGHA